MTHRLSQNLPTLTSKNNSVAGGNTILLHKVTMITKMTNHILQQETDDQNSKIQQSRFCNKILQIQVIGKSTG